MNWNYTSDLYNLINIQVDFNKLFKMMVDTFQPGLMAERPQVLKSNTDRIRLVGYQVFCEHEGLSCTKCSLEFFPVLEATDNDVHLQQNLKELIFFEMFR